MNFDNTSKIRAFGSVRIFGDDAKGMSFGTGRRWSLSRSPLRQTVPPLMLRVPTSNNDEGHATAPPMCASAVKCWWPPRNLGRGYCRVAGLARSGPGVALASLMSIFAQDLDPGLRPGSVASRCWTVFSLRVRRTRIADIASDTPLIWGSPRGDDEPSAHGDQQCHGEVPGYC